MSSSVVGQIPLSVICAGLVALAYLAVRALSDRHDPREPPLAPGSLPVIGHLIGMSRRGFEYYVDISRQVRGAPIFTMPVLGQKMYVVTSLELVQTVQRHKTLLFTPIVARLSPRICGSGPEASRILNTDVTGLEGLLETTMHGMRTTLKPGLQLDQVNRDMVREMTVLVSQLSQSITGGGGGGEGGGGGGGSGGGGGGTESYRTIGLYAWVRGAVTTATTRAIYGPANPYDDKAMADAFWEFEGGIMTIILGILPRITARRPSAARDKVARAFEAYYEGGGLAGASAYARGRYDAAFKHDVPVRDIARFEIGSSVGLLANTAPAVFWTLAHFYSHPGLLDLLRREIDDGCIETSTDPRGGPVTKTFDVGALGTRCPMLASAFQEVLRVRSMGSSVREVMEDTRVGGWLLKKGALVQMPARVTHQDDGLWDGNAGEFEPRRFLAAGEKRPARAYFRAFGGGRTVCMGRQFATNEALTAAALFISRLDMRPAGGGAWKLPTAVKTNPVLGIMSPDADMPVEIRVREGFDSVRWASKLSQPVSVFTMTAEDMADDKGAAAATAAG